MNVKKLNKGFVIVLLVFTFFYVLISEFIASETFGNILTGIVNGSIPKEYSETIKFSSIKVEKFPPRLVFKDFSINYHDESTGLYLQSEVNQLEVGFNLFSNFEEKLHLGNISLKNGYFRFKTKQNSKKENNIIWDELEKDIKTFFRNNLRGFDLGQLVVSRGEIQDIYFEINDTQSFYVNDVALEVYRKSYLFDMNVENVKLNVNGPQELNSFKLRAYLSEKELSIEELSILKEVGLLKIDGLVQNPFETKRRLFSLNATGDFLLDEFMNNENLKKFELGGNVRFHGTIQGKNEIEQANLALIMNQVTSKFVEGDKGAANLVYKNSKLVVKNAFLERGQGQAKVSKEFPIYNFNNKVILSSPIFIDVKNFSLSEGLHVIPKVAQKIDGVVSGGISLLITPHRVDVNVSKKSSIKDFVIGSGEKEVLKIKNVGLQKALYSFSFDRDELKINNEIDIDGKIVNIVGILNDERYAIETSNFFFDAESFEHIAGLKLGGYGKSLIKVDGKFPNIKLNIESDLNNTRIEEFNLGRSESSITIDFAKDSLIFNKILGSLNTGTYRGNGIINYDKGTVDFKSNFDNLSLDDFKLLHYPIIKNLNQDLWTYINGSLSGSYQISGGLSLDKLIVDGKYFSDNIGLLGEHFNFVNAKFNYRNRALKVPNMTINLGRGKIQGNLYYNEISEIFKFNFGSSDILTRDFTYFFSYNAGFVSGVDLTLVGEISPKSTQMNCKVDFYDSSISGTDVENSNINMDYFNGVLQLNGNYLESAVVFNSIIDFNKRNGNNSELQAKFDIKNWAYVLNLFSSYEITSPYLEGSFVASLDSKFNIRDLNRLNLDFDLKKFSFDHPQVDYHAYGKNNIKVVNGDILNWNIDIRGSANEKIISKGHGSIYEDYWGGITANVLLDKINRVLNSLFNLKGNLSIEGQISRKDDRGMPNMDIIFVGDSVSISKTGIPLALNDTEFKINYKNGEVFINKFQSSLGNGLLKLNGKLKWNDFFPEVAVTYEIDDGIIQVNDKSYIVIDGRGNLIGNKRPYSLLGDLRVNGGEILDELSKFSKGSNLVESEEIRFLPKKIDYKNIEWLTLNLNTTIDREVHIRNSLADLKMLGKMNFTGTLDSPIILGKIFSNSDINNKVIIRNNELLVDKFTLTFNGDRNFLNPIVDFASSVQISDYKVFAKMYGPVKNLSVEFSSDPYLDRQSILSLLAFGYAEDVTDRLSQQDRDNLGSIGVGSFIFNQLKINEVLQDNLGVSMNLDTEFQEEESSLLEGRSQTGGQVGNVRSTTTVQLSKKLTEDVNLSLSSSLTGNVGQQQKMNLNYNLEENVSVEGVYELKTDVEGEDQRNDTSIGADLKFRWTFK
ncbi:MAG: translocation/assembly module TamB domain-containing protein [Halobacteriovoraceae bacterium]|nr:translocation/assembly module TamB domain-containing protein [Halobacteriovoraceae bacterium]